MISNRNCFCIKHRIILVLFAGYSLFFSLNSAGNSFQFLGQGIIKTFSMETGTLVFKNGNITKTGDSLKIYASGNRYDYRVLKPGVNIRVYGKTENNVPVVYKVEVSLPASLKRELNLR